MRKSLIFALFTLFTLSMVMVSCDNNNDPNPPENGRNDIQITCTCGNWYEFVLNERDMQIANKSQPDYKVYASGKGGGARLYLLAQDKYPFVTYKETLRGEGYYFWRCACGRYHQISLYDGTHIEIPDGEQPDEWNEFNYLWE